MKNNYQWLCAALLASSFAATPVLANALTPQDFAYGIELETGKQSLQQFELPLHLLQHSQHRNYADVRLFDAAGNTLPFEIRHTPHQSSTTQQALPFIPLDKDTRNDASDIVLKLNQASDTQHIEISTSTATSQQTAATHTPEQYILLNAHKTQKLCALNIDWQAQNNNRLLRFRLESSEHLKRWRPLADNLVLTQLQHADTTLDSKHVEIPCTQAAYLRLSWETPDVAGTIQRIAGHYTETQPAPTRWTPVAVSQPSANNPSQLMFENPGIVNLQHLRLKPADDRDDTGFIFNGTLYSRMETPAGKQDLWVNRGKVKQYRLIQDGKTFISDPVTIRAVRNPFWKLELAQIPVALPQLEIGWQPEQVLFVAQGQAPYTLAYGNAAITEGAHSTITKQLGIDTQELQAETATLGTPMQLGNIQHGDDFPWKQVLMWLTLIAGTGLMAYMAYSLFRQLPKDGDN